MHIAYFTNTYKPTMSGVVRSIDTFRQALTELGHTIFIFAQQARKYEDKEPFVFRYPALEVPFANYYAFPLPVSRSIHEIMPALKLEVIHSHHPFLLGDTAANRAKKLNLPLVFTFHTRYDEYAEYMPFTPKFAKNVMLDWIARYLEKCQHIVTPSDSIREMLIAAGVTGPITTVPTGIDMRPYRRADGQRVREERGWGDDMVLISVGRLAKEKNFETLLEAAARVMRGRENVRLVIVGGGMEENALKKRAEELGIAARVDFTGTIPYEEVPSYLKAADVFVFASITETQGLVTMEAMAADLPVVAVDATGTRDIVTNGKEGLLTENESAALAAAIEQVVGDAGLRERLREAARKTIAWYDAKVQAERMLEVYRQAIEDKKAGRSIRILQD